MYNQWRAFGSLLVAPKIIHLVREPYAVAKSNLATNAGHKGRSWEDREQHHFFEPVQRSFVLEERGIEHRVQSLRRKVSNARTLLKDIDHMEISYEEITGNKSVSRLSSGVSKKLTDFLGVEEAVLITEFVKPDTVYTIKRTE